MGQRPSARAALPRPQGAAADSRPKNEENPAYRIFPASGPARLSARGIAASHTAALAGRAC
jgi:hypothetical protein